MKKSHLLTLLLTFVGIFTTQATSVAIDVDKASNVIVQTSSGYGQTLSLEDGMNRFDLDEQNDIPLLISAAQGAEIVEVTKNGTETVSKSGDGNYRVGFSGPTMIKITTNGSGSGGGEISKDITMDFFASGEGVTGKPFKVYYQKDSEWVAPETGSMNYCIIPEKANVKIVPDKAFEISGCSVPGSSVQLNGTIQEDGSYTFVNNVPDYYRVQVDMKLKASAIRFSITVDYSANVDCYLENQREGAWELLTVYDNMKNEFTIDASQNPLEFIPAEGAEIIQVLKNGVVQSPIGWGGSNGWIFEAENGDEFTLATKGSPTDIVIEAPEGQASLEGYFFKRADGTHVTLTGGRATYSGHLGEMIYVSGRPGTTLTYVVGTNGGITNMLDNIRVVKGSDGSNPAAYQIFGKRDINGIVISVDDAKRVSVVQEGGRGDALVLDNGANKFSVSEIKNALAVSATEGNQIVSVTVNGNGVQVSPNGYYMVTAEEGDYIEVESRKSPVDAVLSFSFNEGADITWLQATSEGYPVELSNPMTVKSYTKLVISASDGYVLEEVSTETPGVSVLQIDGQNKYEVYVSSADVTNAAIDVKMKEMQASEGNSIVVANGDALLVRFWEMSEKDGVLSETFVKALENNRVNEVKTGNWIQVYCKDTQSEFKYVRVNGNDADLVRNDEGLARTAWVEVTGRTVIETLVATPCQATTNPTYDDTKHIISGNVYIEIDGERYTNVFVEAGQTVKLVAEPETGYVFDHFEKFLPLTMASDGTVLEGDTYTFTEADAAENFILFKGVFKEDGNAKVYALRGSTAWLLDENGVPVQESSEALGNVGFLLADGTVTRETTAVEGQTVHLEIIVFDEETVANYEVAGFSLMRGFPDAIIPTDYVVKGDDADDEGVIWINGLMRHKNVSVGEAFVGEGFGYDASTMTVSASGPVKVFDSCGQLMLASEESQVSVAHLQKGLYVAVSGNRSIKFVK